MAIRPLLGAVRSRAGRQAWTAGAGGAGASCVAPVPGQPASWRVSSRTKVPIGRYSVYNGTFVIGIRLSSAYVEIIFAADSILEQPAPPAERQTFFITEPRAGGPFCPTLAGESEPCG